MPSMIRPSRRFPVPCAVTYNAGPFLTMPLACISGFWLLITLLVVSHGPAYADWVAVDEKYQVPGLQTLYVDPDTIRREENLVTMVILVDWMWMQGNGRRAHRFMSTKTHKQFDCADKRLRLLAFTEFSRHMGTGRRNDGYVDQDNWLSVEPESVNQGLWEVACGKE